MQIASKIPEEDYTTLPNGLNYQTLWGLGKGVYVCSLTLVFYKKAKRLFHVTQIYDLKAATLTF
ncbi:hypothetical protein ACLOJK_020928 [Asimina triloba]